MLRLKQFGQPGAFEPGAVVVIDVVDANDWDTLCKQPSAEMRSDETRSTGDEKGRDPLFSRTISGFD